jgi:DnaK suppressor protein
MDDQRARALIDTERTRVEALVADTRAAAIDDRSAELEQGDLGDSAEPLTAEASADAVSDALQQRLDALDRAERRIDDGTYGRSVRSGRTISDERLEADPAAELTVEEADEQ